MLGMGQRSASHPENEFRSRQEGLTSLPSLIACGAFSPLREMKAISVSYEASDAHFVVSP
jgi:hypothetical protein